MRGLYTLTLLCALCSLGAQTGAPLMIVSDPVLPCQGRAVRFQVAGDSLLTDLRWTVVPARQVSAASGTSRTFATTFSSPSTYTVRVEATDSVKRTGSLAVTVSRSARASFNASLTSQGYPADLVLTNYSTSYLNTVWYFNDGAPDSSLNATRSYISGGSKEVRLVAYGINNCNDTASYRFHIADSSGITLPNIFTPNGDGVNEVYKPIARGIRSLHGMIFNRDQTLLFEWNTVNGAWDGRTTSGEPCAEGVYIAVVEGVGFDGKNYRMSTSLTLLR